MVSVTAYGGAREIGGNKILLEDGDKKLLLDFGFPFGTHKLYYEEYLQPRGGAGLLDPMTMGLIPPLKGIYRGDLDSSELWQRFSDHPAYREVKDIDGVLLTHAHIDHSGHIAFLRENIPVYSTAMTAFIAKAIQDSGKSGFDSQICYFGPVKRDCPRGWKQEAYMSSKESKRQRKFNIQEDILQSLGDDARQFWQSGFWETGSRSAELISCPLADHKNCLFDLRCFPVDHSIPGACAWGINTSSGWVIYSGDLRLHGKRVALTEKFIEAAARLNPVALIIEGTNINKDKNIYEKEVYDNALEAISGVTGLVIADFSARDTDRLLTFLEIARKTNRKLAILPRDAYLLKTIRLIEPETPDIASDDNIVIYQETTSSPYPATWMRNLFDEYASKTVLAADVSKAQDEYMLSFSFFDLNELPSILPQTDSLYVFSSSEPHDEEQKIDFKRLHNWLDRFKMKRHGLPIEIITGEGEETDWIIPEDQKGLHASGHACEKDLIDMALKIKPQILIPVHTTKPELYEQYLADTNISVRKPEGCQPIIF